MGLYSAAGRIFGGFFHTGDPEHPPPLHQNPWVYFILVGLLLPPLIWVTGLGVHRPPTPQVVATLPDFSLVDQDGQPFTRADLAGNVWITGFVFSSCQEQCPRILTVMKGIQDDIAIQEPFEGYEGRLRLLAFSVDPTTDTPEVLRKTMATYGLDPARFTMLTGDDATIRAVVEGGFALAVGERDGSVPGTIQIAHSNKLAIVDGDGGVRGFYGLEPLEGHVSLTGSRLGTDYDGPAAVRGWASVVLHAQGRP